MSASCHHRRHVRVEALYRPAQRPVCDTLVVSRGKALEARRRRGGGSAAFSQLASSPASRRSRTPFAFGAGDARSVGRGSVPVARHRHEARRQRHGHARRGLPGEYRSTPSGIPRRAGRTRRSLTHTAETCVVCAVSISDRTLSRLRRLRCAPRPGIPFHRQRQDGNGHCRLRGTLPALPTLAGESVLSVAVAHFIRLKIYPPPGVRRASPVAGSRRSPHTGHPRKPKRQRERRGRPPLALVRHDVRLTRHPAVARWLAVTRTLNSTHGPSLIPNGSHDRSAHLSAYLATRRRDYGAALVTLGMLEPSSRRRPFVSVIPLAFRRYRCSYEPRSYPIAPAVGVWSSQILV
jgi:hypothetical protein